MSERKRLVNQLKDMGCYNQQVLDFILADRKRICEPLNSLPGEFIGEAIPIIDTLKKAIRETLTLAGIEEAK